MTPIKHLIQATAILSLVMFGSACGSSSSKDPNDKVAGEYQSATFLANTKTYDSFIMLNKWVLNGDGTGTGSAIFSDGRQTSSSALDYEVDTDGSGTCDVNIPNAQPVRAYVNFTEDTKALSRIDEDPNDFNQGIGIGFGVQPDTSVKSIEGEYHSYILYHISNSSAFGVTQHNFIFSGDGTGTVIAYGQSIGFTYSISDGLIIMNFSGGPTSDPISAYISTDGNYLIAYDALNLDQNIGIQIFIKAGSGLSTSDVSGQYTMSALHNTLGRSAIPWTLRGSADFDGEGVASITSNGGQAPITANYQVASDGEILLTFPGSEDVEQGWVSPNREVIVLIDTLEAPINDQTLAYSILTKEW